MGEKKRREEKLSPETRRQMAFTRALVDNGLVVEAGWLGLKHAWVPPDAPVHQVTDLRMAFFAGSLHIFQTLMTMWEEGDSDEVEEVELQRMENIKKELDTFGEQLELTLSAPEGKAN